MIQIAEVVVSIVRDAWTAFAAILVIVTILGVLARVLQGAGGIAIGGSRTTATAIAGAAGVFVMGLVGLVVVPAIAHTAYTIAVGAGSEACGAVSSEVGDLGVASAMLIGAIGALRMLHATVEGTAYAALGSGKGLARIVTTVVETLVGMALVPAAVPIVAAFLGC